MFDGVQGVLFDLGGTLVDYPIPRWPTVIRLCAKGVYLRAFRPGDEPPPAASLPPPKEAGRLRSPAPPTTALPHRMTVALRRIIRGASGRTLPRVAERCMRPLLARGRPFEETYQVLEALREGDYALGLISNTPWGTPDYLWEAQLARFGLTPYFPVRLFSSGIGHRKPDTRIFNAALARLGLPPSKTLFVGDTPAEDIAGAKAIGMPTALIARPGAPVGSGPKPDMRIGDLRELLRVLPPCRQSGATQTATHA